MPLAPALAHTVTRATLMGARGNSGVILSQIVRGAAEVLGAAETLDTRIVAEALRAASDIAYRGVRQPVEGTILTVIREIAEEAEARATPSPRPDELLRAVLARGEAALARTPELLDVLRDAGVVDAGGAGLVEIMRGIVAAVTGEELDAARRAVGARLWTRSTASSRSFGTARPSSSKARVSTPLRWSTSWRRSATRCSSWATRRR